MAAQQFFYVAEQTKYDYPSGIDVFEIRTRNVNPRPVQTVWVLIYCDLSSISISRPNEYPTDHKSGEFNPRNISLSLSILKLKAKISLDGELLPLPVMEPIDINPEILGLGPKSDEMLTRARSLLNNDKWVADLQAHVFG